MPQILLIFSKHSNQYLVKASGVRGVDFNLAGIEAPPGIWPEREGCE
jgi:hypothetical protein